MVMTFRGTDPVRAKIVIDGTVLEQVSNFEYLGYSVSYNACNDVVNKLHKFNLMCGTIRRTLKSASKGTRLKFYKMMALPTLLYGSENWTLIKGQASGIQASEMRFSGTWQGILSMIIEETQIHGRN